MTAERANSKNIRITVPGVTFLNHEGQAFFATPLTLPDEVANFLSRKGYKILSLAQLMTADKGR